MPAGAWRTTAERMAWLNHAAADFQLFTLDERSEELAAVDFRDTGNLESRLVHAFSAAAAIERCKEGVAQLLALAPPEARERIEVRPSSATDIGLLLHGLEFARVRHGFAANSFARQDQITFGAGANETPLTPETEPLCRELFSRLFLSRHSDGAHTDPLFRMQPERWLEARLRREIAELLPGLRGDLLYTQVPALSAGDRGLLDLLTLERNGRLTVIELKADEDLHLPLQALDYWIRVRALNDDRQPARATRADGRSPPSSARATLRALRFRRCRRGCCWRPGAAHPSRQRAGAALFFSAGRVGADRAYRTLAAGAEGGLPQAKRSSRGAVNCPPSGLWLPIHCTQDAEWMGRGVALTYSNSHHNFLLESESIRKTGCVAASRKPPRLTKQTPGVYT